MRRTLSVVFFALLFGCLPLLSAAQSSKQYFGASKTGEQFVYYDFDSIELKTDRDSSVWEIVLFNRSLPPVNGPEFQAMMANFVKEFGVKITPGKKPNSFYIHEPHSGSKQFFVPDILSVLAKHYHATMREAPSYASDLYAGPWEIIKSYPSSDEYKMSAFYELLPPIGVHIDISLKRSNSGALYLEGFVRDGSVIQQFVITPNGRRYDVQMEWTKDLGCGHWDYSETHPDLWNQYAAKYAVDLPAAMAGYLTNPMVKQQFQTAALTAIYKKPLGNKPCGG